MDMDNLANPVSAGALGSFISLKWAPGRRFIDKIVNVSSSMAIVYFLSPAINDFFNVQKESYGNVLAFSVGMFGLNLVARIWQEIGRLEIASTIRTVVLGFFGKK